MILLLDKLSSRLRVELGQESSGGFALQFGTVGRGRDHVGRAIGVRMALMQGEVVFLPAVEGHVHVDVEDVGRLVDVFGRSRLRVRRLVMLVLDFADLDEVGCRVAVGVEDGDVEVVDIEVQVDEVRKFLVTYGGHIAELLGLRPLWACCCVHRIDHGVFVGLDGCAAADGAQSGRQRRERRWWWAGGSAATVLEAVQVGGRVRESVRFLRAAEGVAPSQSLMVAGRDPGWLSLPLIKR